ncbi:MAG: DNA primase [Patescibacteria group bacterium]
MDPQVQQIKDRINIVEVVGQYVTLKRAGRSYSARCPFHKERTPSFHVSPERGTYICFGCGEKGDVFSFIQKMDGLDFPTALKQLAEKAGVKLEPRRQRPPEEKEKEERLREVCEAAVKFFESQLAAKKDVQEYLKNRGVKAETVNTWRLGYAPAEWESLCRHLVSTGFTKDEVVEAGFAVRSEKKPGEIFDRFRGRIIFPIFDVAGIPIAVSGRFFEKVPGSHDDTEPAKYVNSPETLLFKKSRVLYGLDRARGSIRKADCILLVEGQFDLIMAHQSGLPFAVALSGTALTPEHLSLLGRLSKRLVLALDADAAGLRSGLKSAHMALVEGFDVKVPAFPQGQDPADVAKENPELLKAAVRTSKTAVEFFLDALRPGARDERAYKKIVEAQVLPLIAAIGSRIEQEHFVRLVAQKLGVSDMAVRAEVEKRPQPADTASSPEVHQVDAKLVLTPVEKKVGMLLFGWPGYEPKLAALLGGGELEEMRKRLAPAAEELRHYFDKEVHEETTAQIVAEDMFLQVAATVSRAKMKSV